MYQNKMVRDDEAGRLRARLQELHRRQRREAPTIAGVTRSAVRVLSSAARSGQTGVPARPAEVAEELGMQRSNVATALRELEDAGLIARTSAGRDGRGVDILLTEAGEAAVARHRNGRDTWLATAIEATLSPAEQAQLFAAGELIERIARYDGGTK